MFNKTQLIESRAKTPSQVPLAPSPGYPFPYLSAALSSGHQEIRTQGAGGEPFWLPSGKTTLEVESSGLVGMKH